MARDAALSLLLAEQERERKPKTQQQGFTADQLLRFASGAAPIVGGVAGTALGTVVPGVGNAVGGAVGGGLGSLAGLGLGAAADHMQREREQGEIDDEEEALREMARKRTLLSLLG